MKTIHVVHASRGDYSDREDYVVCWYEDQASAELAAALMQQRSDSQRERIARRWDPALWDAAKEEIGDPHWSAADYTSYSAHELPHGKEKP